MKSILVVCEGNICRSPMAQGILRHRLPDLAVSSAGLGALIGQPADDIAIRLMRERRIDISGHRAIQISRNACVAADLILTMSVSQRQRIEEMYPQVCGRVFRIAEHLKRDVADPYLKPERAFRDVLSVLEDAVKEWESRIRKIAKAYK